GSADHDLPRALGTGRGRARGAGCRRGRGSPSETCTAMTESSVRTLVAGVGNIFFGDDGFGVEVAKRLAECELPAGVTVADYGISGMHLAYDLSNGYERAILIDAAPRGGTPGTVYVMEPTEPAEASTALFDAHGMQPDVVLGMLGMLGGTTGRLL